MLLTDVKKEIEGIKNAEGLSWQDIADRMGIHRQSVRSNLDRQNFFSKGALSVLEAMGYDVEIKFIRRTK